MVNNRREQLILSSAVLAGSIVLLGTRAMRMPFTAHAAHTTISPPTFEERLAGYVELRRHIVEQARQEQSEEGDWADAGFRQLVATRMQAARRSARPGDVFGDCATRIRQIVRRDRESRAGLDWKAVLYEVPVGVPLRVNGFYPDDAPTATVPPLLLMQLAPLTSELQYRFLDDAVILLDLDTSLIVDFVPDALGRRL